LDEKKFPPLFHVNGEDISMLVLVPQFTSQPATREVIEFIQYAIKNYRIDTTRIYMTGFSSGGRTLVDVTADYPNRFAAIVPIAGSANYNASEKSQSIANGNVRVWAFHNLNDQLIDHTETKNFIEAIKTFNPSLPARMTIFPGFAGTQAHDAWTKATNPEYQEDGKNIYEWMLQFKR
jgi:predicted peptidase